VLTNDTSAVHLAAATGVPAVCITGGGHWRRFVPYPASLGIVADLVEVVSMEQDMTCFNCDWRCVLPHVNGEALPCVSRVPVARVIEAVDRVLSHVMVTLPNG
jgi:ADP-heptose:LPS heptosyltransferase